MATGDYIGFVDGDDTIEADMYEILINNAVKYDADISHCGYRVIEGNKETLFYDSKNLIIQDRKKGILDLFDGTLVEPSLCNKIFKRKIVGDIRLDETIKINEDLLFNVFLFNNSFRSVFEDKAKYNYIKRDGSATTCKMNDIRKVTDPRKVYRNIVELFNKDEEILPYAKKMEFSRNINIYNLLNLNKSDEFINLKDEIRNYIKLSKNEIINNQIIGKKIKVMTFGIIYLTKIYDFIYRMYYGKKYDK